MKIQNKSRGEAVQPLERLTLEAVLPGEVIVSDALGREYKRVQGGKNVSFQVGGAAGVHTIAHSNGQRLHFKVEPQTFIRDRGSHFGTLLDILIWTMVSESDVRQVRRNGKLYRFFIPWLRDHVHVMKGMKYFSEAGPLREAIELYRDAQRDDGMIWDNVYRRPSAPSYWDDRLQNGDFIRPFESGEFEFRRIPVEADVEYLFVEGLYYTWKALGDDAWMQQGLEAARKALDYCVTSPYRWSKKYRLIKRGYTIDTWDFQNDYDRIIEGDIMRVEPEKTRFGIMFGDNTGYIAACGYLAAMLEQTGRLEDAQIYRTRAREMKKRLDDLSWNGRFFTHHIRETPYEADFGVDESTQVSLSNAYSLNRGLSAEQCRAIIATYQRIKEQLPAGAPGEWYTIYPPFRKGFSSQAAPWQYVNGGVTPFVAGELAHGAFQHGFEAYGADILTRLLALARKHGDKISACYTGALLPPPVRHFVPLELEPLVNVAFDGQGTLTRTGWTGEGDNDLHEMMGGEKVLAGIEWNVPTGALGLSRKKGYAERLEISVGRTATSLYFLHTSAKVGSDNIAGQLTFEYSDNTRHSLFIVRGQNIAGWWQPTAPDNKTTVVAWRGKNKKTANVGLVAWGCNNPHPEKAIARLVLESVPNGALWLVAGITLCDVPASFGESPISYGLPNGWSAASVVYALIEGLAGVVDKATTFETVELSPRWESAGVGEVEVCVTYPASGGYLAYRYRASENEIWLESTGSGTSCAVHLLLPSRGLEIHSVNCNGVPCKFTRQDIGDSSYLDFKLPSLAPHQTCITFSNTL